MSLEQQFELVIYAIIYGLFIGITYDCMCILKQCITSKTIEFFIICLFWFMHVPVVIIYLTNVNEGIFHLYIFLFFLVGMIIYFLYFQNKFRQDLKKLGDCISLILRFLMKTVNLLVISPLLFIYKLLSDIIVMFLRMFKHRAFVPFTNRLKRMTKRKKVSKRGKKVDTSDG